MKILIFLLLLFGLKSNANIKKERPYRSCFSYVVMNRSNYEVVAGNNVHGSRSVASISKIMTAIIALESERLFDVVKIPLLATKQEGSSLYLKEGEQLTVLDLVYGLLLRSGNDAAYTLAYYLGPTLDNFIIKMNEKAKGLGMNDSIFNNPSGLDIFDDGNISSAYDMAKLYSYASHNDLFQSIVSKTSYTSNYGTWLNKNKLLRRYKYCDGGKTGYTYKAKRTLVSGATYESTSLTIVTLNCGDDFNFHQELYEYFFDTYAYIPFLIPGENKIGNYVYKSDKYCGIWIEKNKLDKKTIKSYLFDDKGELKEMKLFLSNGEVIRVNL